jgi:putative phosphoribosyl transferase
VKQHDIRIPLPPFTISGTVELPEQPSGLVVLAQGSGAHLPARRDQVVLDTLAEERIGGARLDLIMPAEGEVAEDTRLVWSDVHLLAGRLAIATDWLVHWAETLHLPIGYLGAGTNAAVALLAAAARPLLVKAIVTCDGRPDLIGPALRSVVTPTLFLVHGDNPRGLQVNRRAMETLGGTQQELHILSGDARHPHRRATLPETAQRSRNWFVRFMSPPAAAEARPGAEGVPAIPQGGLRIHV